MRKTVLDDSRTAVPLVSPDKSSSRTRHTRNSKKLSTRSTAQDRNSAISDARGKENADTRPARFGALPLQEARVLQQLQTLSISSTSAAPSGKAPSARHIKQFIPTRKPGLVKQPKLYRFKVDLAGNTDSEVDSPLSQPVIRSHHSPGAASSRHPKVLPSVPGAVDACSQHDDLPAVGSPVCPLLHNLLLGSASAAAISPSRTELAVPPNCITDTPDSMTMSTPACGQAPPSSGTSPLVPMSCSSAGIHSANPLRHAVACGVESPMCISPDTWATPHQLEWKLSPHNLSAAQDSPQLQAKPPSPSASQMHIANLQFGLEAIKDAAAAETAAAGACRRSRLASSSSMPDHVAGLSDTDSNSKEDTDASDGQLGNVNRRSHGSDRGFGGYAEEAEWMEDLEVTPTPSQEASPSPSGDASSGQADLQLDLGSDDGTPHKSVQGPRRESLFFQQQRVADEAFQQDSLLHPCQPMVEDSSIDQPEQLPVPPDQLRQAARISVECGRTSDEQLQAAHKEYAAALRSDRQQQQQHSAQAMPDLHRHLHPQSQQLPQQPPPQLPQQQQQGQQQGQHLPEHLHVRNASELQLPQPKLPQPPQLQQQQLLEQQQALAAYQAALGRPMVQQTAGPAQGTAQHQLHAKLPDSAIQHQQARGIGQPLPAQLPQQLPQQLPGQGSRKVQGSVTLPCDVAQAHNVYKAFQWQKDAIGYADACNRQAAGLEAYPCQQESAPADVRRPQDTDSRQQGSAQTACVVPETVKVFCEEVGSAAGFHRQFVAASYGRFWARYAPRLGQRPHCYEVVKGGAPCHLYFDTEFATECNPGLDGEALLGKLLQACQRVISNEFQLDLQPNWIYELDSSHSGKFSRHLILRLPGAAFVNNWAVGHLVGQILAEPEGMEILVRKKSDQPGAEQFTSLVDTAVYTRNRHLRLIWSCKAGKAHVLNPTNRFATARGFNKSQRELFMDALICNVDPNSRLLMADMVPTGLAFHSSHAATSFGSSRHIGYIVHGQHEVKVAHKCDAFDSSDAAPLTQERVQGWAEQAARHVEEVARFRAGGLPASVRTIAHCGFTGTVAYSLTGPGSHYCEHIGRCHQSNRVFFVVNFLTGMLAQKCHDPECSHFRSTWTPLPQPLLDLDRH